MQCKRTPLLQSTSLGDIGVLSRERHVLSRCAFESQAAIERPRGIARMAVEIKEHESVYATYSEPFPKQLRPVQHANVMVRRNNHTSTCNLDGAPSHPARKGHFATTALAANKSRAEKFIRCCRHAQL